MFQIIAQEADFIVVSKDAGVNFHTEDGVKGLLVEVESALNTKLYAVHRLDKMTSGLLLLATSSEAAAKISELFRERKVEKYYLSISDQKPRKKQGMIKGDMAKSRRGAYKLLKTNENPAVTQFFSYSLRPGVRLYVIKPATGKTHQIRVAMKSIGAPSLGDSHYGGSSSDRGYLHAYQLHFTYDNKNFSYTSMPQTGHEYISPECATLLETFDQKGGVLSLPWPKVSLPSRQRPE